MLQREHYLPSYLCDGTDIEELFDSKEDKFHFLTQLVHYYSKVVFQEAVDKHMDNIVACHTDVDGEQSVFLHTAFITCDGDHEITVSMMMSNWDDNGWDFDIQVLGSVKEGRYVTGGIYEDFIPIADDIQEEFKDFVLNEIEEPSPLGEYSVLSFNLRNMLPAYLKCINIVDQRIKEFEAE